MKTIHIIALHLAFGGVEKAIVNMANLFADRYNVEIISVYDMPSAPVYKIDERVSVRYLLKDIPNRAQWHEAVKNRDVIGFIRESFKSAAILSGKKLGVIRTIYGIKDGIIITTRHEDNLVLSAFGRSGVLKIAQLHHDHRFEKQYVEAFKNKYSNIDYFTVLTPLLKDEISEMMKNTKTKVVCIPNFIDQIPEKVDTEKKEKTVVAAGRLHVMKRFDSLIRIFASVHERVPEWKLRIVGDGEERPKLEKLIEEYNASNYITLVGMTDAKGVEEEMKRASIYAMTSSSEGFAFVIVEAQSCYLPVVAFDVRVGPPYLVSDGADGFLVPDNAEKEYGDRLVELMLDDELRKRMGEASRKQASKFSKENISKLWYELLGD